ncbi:MAG: hypothetical protein WKF86_09085 [Acidimicrobiales bacterium]
MPPTETTTPSVPGCSELDDRIEKAIGDYTDRVRNDRPYEDTVGADELRHRYDKK